jgi:ABC-2 type transport system ATP-binding protein
VIQVDTPTRTFPDAPAPALARLSLSVGAGEIVAMAGRNGAGKTTLLDVLSTLLLPSAGTARVAGFDVERDANAVRRSIGYAMTGPRGLHMRLTGRRNLEFFAALHPQIASPRARVAELVQLLDLGAYVDRQVVGCSEGMQQTLVLARALLGRPPVLLLDEPTRGLDPVARRRFAATLDGLVRRGEVKAVLYATHEIEDAAAPSTRTILLSRGTIVFDGAPSRGQIADLLEAEGAP